jgi:hypothetical protein
MHNMIPRQTNFCGTAGKNTGGLEAIARARTSTALARRGPHLFLVVDNMRGVAACGISGDIISFLFLVS